MPVRDTSIREISELLSHLGIDRGQIVMIHSALFTLGRIEGGLQGFYEAVRNSIGEEGTLIVPTFTYSYRRKQIFDVYNSKTSREIGVFAEFVRQIPGAVRSLDPLFAMSAIGPKADELMGRTSHNCFGAGSIYERLFAEQTSFVGVGITYGSGLTAFLHLERLADVGYRHEMKFDGVTIGYEGVCDNDWAIHFVRDEESYPNIRSDRSVIGARLEETKISKAVDFGSGHHFAIPAQGFRDFVLSALEDDPEIMVAEKLIN